MNNRRDCADNGAFVAAGGLFISLQRNAVAPHLTPDPAPCLFGHRLSSTPWGKAFPRRSARFSCQRSRSRHRGATSRLRGCQTADGEKQRGGAEQLDLLQTTKTEEKRQVAHFLVPTPHEDPHDPLKQVLIRLPGFIYKDREKSAEQSTNFKCPPSAAQSRTFAPSTRTSTCLSFGRGRRGPRETVGEITRRAPSIPCNLMTTVVCPVLTRNEFGARYSQQFPADDLQPSVWAVPKGCQLGG